MMKNTFHFTFKLFSLLRYLNSCPDFFGHVEERLDKKLDQFQNLRRHLQRHKQLHTY